MKIALFENTRNSMCKNAFDKAYDYLKKQDVTLSLFREQEPIPEEVVPTLDLAITFGGDGALLHAVHRLGIQHPPLVGVNVGSLGFLAEIHIDYLEKALHDLCQKNFSLLELLIIERKDTNGAPHHFAVNEIVFHRECVHNLVDLSITVDGQFFNCFSSDGLILATPGGSTAYSLAAGGPIVSPTLDALIITPICPHTISNKPVVLSPPARIDITLTRGADSVGIAIDGMHGGKLLLNQTSTITISPHRFKLVAFPSYNYFQALRQKLGWTGSLKK